jgi:hypothetical protein
VDVGGRGGGGLVVTLEAIDGDVVADDVLVGVDTEVEQASAALKTTREFVRGVDDLVGRGNDLVGRGEDEGALVLGVGTGSQTPGVLGDRGGLGQSGEGKNGNGLHDGWLKYGNLVRVEKNANWDWCDGWWEERLAAMFCLGVRSTLYTYQTAREMRLESQCSRSSASRPPRSINWLVATSIGTKSSQKLDSFSAGAFTSVARKLPYITGSIWLSYLLMARIQLASAKLALLGRDHCTGCSRIRVTISQGRSCS